MRVQTIHVPPGTEIDFHELRERARKRRCVVVITTEPAPGKAKKRRLRWFR